MKSKDQISQMLERVETGYEMDESRELEVMKLTLEWVLGHHDDATLEVYFEDWE